MCVTRHGNGRPFCFRKFHNSPSVAPGECLPHVKSANFNFTHGVVKYAVPATACVLTCFLPLPVIITPVPLGPPPSNMLSRPQVLVWRLSKLHLITGMGGSMMVLGKATRLLKRFLFSASGEYYLQVSWRSRRPRIQSLSLILHCILISRLAVSFCL